MEKKPDSSPVHFILHSRSRFGGMGKFLPFARNNCMASPFKRALCDIKVMTEVNAYICNHDESHRGFLGQKGK